jgi:hypothetical protein
MPLAPELVVQHLAADATTIAERRENISVDLLS